MYYIFLAAADPARSFAMLIFDTHVLYYTLYIIDESAKWLYTIVCVCVAAPINVGSITTHP